MSRAAKRRAYLARLRRWRDGREAVKHALPAVKHGIMMERSSHPMSQPVHPQPEHIPAGCALERRPTRDDREEERLELRTADGRVLALVERVDPASLPN